MKICFFCKQQTAYEMRISDWSSDVCSSNLSCRCNHVLGLVDTRPLHDACHASAAPGHGGRRRPVASLDLSHDRGRADAPRRLDGGPGRDRGRSEEHTSELQSLMRTSYAAFCLKKKNNQQE